MRFHTLVILAFGLAMDAFTVSVANGLCYRGSSLKKLSLVCGAAFGFFQGLMPILGYLAGSAFASLIERYDHWIALFLLSFIGGRMIHEALRPKEVMQSFPHFSGAVLLTQAVATSIDAMAVGISFAVMGVDILVSSALISVITFCCCVAGVAMGKRFGYFLRGKAELLGGVILILIGLHILIEHIEHGV